MPKLLDKEVESGKSDAQGSYKLISASLLF